MYVLILTLFADYHGTGVAVTHIPGFASQESCLAAGNSWLKQVAKEKDKTYYVRAAGSALCVSL